MPKPERMCVACRTKGEASDFVRLTIAPDGSLLWDLKQKLPGRGVYLCPGRPCLQRGLHEKKLLSALRVEALHHFDPERLRQELVLMLRQQAVNTLKIAIKARKVLSGFTQVQQGIKKALAKVLVLADDIGLERSQELTLAARTAGIGSVHLLCQEEMGELFQTERRSCLVITDRGLASTFMNNFERYRTMKKEGM